MKTEILEPSTNTHSITADEIKIVKITESILKIKTGSNGVVRHGEHGTICTEKPNVIKYVQQELNPLTKAFQNAFD